MVCEFCHSDNIATIKGQNFCLNCGHQLVHPLSDPKPAKTPAPAPAKAATPEQPKPVVPKPEPPKSEPAPVKIEAPKPEPVAHTVPKSHLKPKPAHHAKKGTPLPTAARILAGEGHAEATLPVEHHPKKRQVSVALDSPGSLTRRSIQLTFSQKLPVTHFFADLLLAAALIGPVLLLNRLSQIAGTLPTGQIYKAAALAYLALGLSAIVLKTWTSSSASYGFSKILDHRPAHPHSWQRAGGKLLPRVLVLRIVQTALVAATLYGWWWALDWSTLHPIYGIPSVAVPIASSLLGIYLIAIIAAAGNLTKAAIVADNRSLRKAVKSTSRALRRRLDLVLMAGMANVWLLTIPLSVIVGSLWGLSWASGQSFGKGLGLAPILGGGLLLITFALYFGLLLSQSLWLLTYQRLSRS